MPKYGVRALTKRVEISVDLYCHALLKVKVLIDSLKAYLFISFVLKECSSELLMSAPNKIYRKFKLDLHLNMPETNSIEKGVQ